MIEFIEGKVFETIEEMKTVYDKDGKATEQKELRKSIGFMVREKDEDGKQKKSSIVYVKVDVETDLKKYPEDTQVRMRVKTNRWIDGKRARISRKLVGEIKIIDPKK